MIEKFISKNAVQDIEANYACKDSWWSLRLLVKNILNLLKVPNYDHQCPSTTNILPIGFDPVTGLIQRYDPSQQIYVNVNIIAGFNSLINYRLSNISTSFLITDRVLEITVVGTVSMNFIPLIGMIYYIKNSSIGIVILDGAAYNIDGFATHNIPSGESRSLFFNGTQFIII